MPLWAWLAAACGVIALTAVLLVWLLVVTEGTYLGPGVVTALYDRVAGRYDRIKQFDASDEAYFLGEPVARYLAGLSQDPETAPWVLDVAAGTGRFSLAVLQAAAGRCRCIALDRSEGMLRQAQAKMLQAGWREVVLVRHDAAPLPFAGGQFDVVGCLEALEFTPDPKAVLLDMMRVLKPGGLVLVTRRIGRDARLMPGKVYSRQELSELLRSAGAGAVDIRPWQVDYDLAWALKSEVEPAPSKGVHWMELVRCPRHRADSLEQIVEGDRETLRCRQCGWRLQCDQGLWQPVRLGSEVDAAIRLVGQPSTGGVPPEV